MTKLKLPGLLFAKRLNVSAAPGHQYDILFSHNDFSTKALTEILHKVKHFQWRPGSESCYSPIIGWCKLSGIDALIIRYLDDGPDDVGRPHCLRMEVIIAPCANASAVIATLDKLGDTPLRECLDDNTWHIDITNETGAPPVPLTDKIQLRGNTGNCLLLPVRENTDNCLLPSAQNTINAPHPTFISQHCSNVPHKESNMKFFWIIPTLIALLAIFAYQYTLINDYRNRLDISDGQLKETQQSLEKKEKALNEAKDALKLHEAKIDQLKQENLDLTKRIDEEQRANQVLNDQLKEKNPDTAKFFEENKKLRRENKKLRKLLNDIASQITEGLKELDSNSNSIWTKVLPRE